MAANIIAAATPINILKTLDFIENPLEYAHEIVRQQKKHGASFNGCAIWADITLQPSKVDAGHPVSTMRACFGVKFHGFSGGAVAEEIGETETFSPIVGPNPK